MRQFEKMIFLGNGESSKAKCYDLHKRLDLAIEILGGLQQSSMGNKITRKMHIDRKNLAEEVKDIVSDITVALLGEKYTVALLGEKYLITKT